MAGWRTAGPQGGPGGPGSTGRPRCPGPGAGSGGWEGTQVTGGAAQALEPQQSCTLRASRRARPARVGCWCSKGPSASLTGTASGGAAYLSVGAGSVFDDHGRGVRFVVAEDRFSAREGGGESARRRPPPTGRRWENSQRPWGRRLQGRGEGVGALAGGPGEGSECWKAPAHLHPLPEPHGQLKPDGGAAPGPGRSPPTTGLCPGPPGARPRCRPQLPHGSWGETVPEDLGSAEGPPGCQVLAVEQHTGLRSHEEEVLARLPRHVRQVAEGSWAAGTGGDSRCGRQARPVLSLPAPHGCSPPRPRCPWR